MADNAPRASEKSVYVPYVRVQDQRDVGGRRRCNILRLAAAMPAPNRWQLGCQPGLALR